MVFETQIESTKMKHLKPFKVFEELGTKPKLRFPTDPAVHYNYLYEIVENSGLDPDHLGGGDLSDFFFEKCSLDIPFPLIRENEIWEHSARYNKMIFKESIFLIPEYYDPKNDELDYIEKKENFFNNMINLVKNRKTEEELEEYKKDLEKHVKFGPASWGWINPALKVIHDELGEHYKDGKLRAWMPSDRDYKHWNGLDYPHKYNVVGDPDHPNGVYYLSDIEKYIEYKYDLKDNDLYNFIIDNEYIEGRYWERVWSFSIDDKGSNKLSRGRDDKYGMKATENISNILGLNMNSKMRLKEVNMKDFLYMLIIIKKLKLNTRSFIIFYSWGGQEVLSNFSNFDKFSSSYIQSLNIYPINHPRNRNSNPVHVNPMVSSLLKAGAQLST